MAPSFSVKAHGLATSVSLGVERALSMFTRDDYVPVSRCIASISLGHNLVHLTIRRNVVSVVHDIELNRVSVIKHHQTGLGKSARPSVNKSEGILCISATIITVQSRRCDIRRGAQIHHE